MLYNKKLESIAVFFHSFKFVVNVLPPGNYVAPKSNNFFKSTNVEVMADDRDHQNDIGDAKYIHLA